MTTLLTRQALVLPVALCCDARSCCRRLLHTDALMLRLSCMCTASSTTSMTCSSLHVRKVTLPQLTRAFRLQDGASKERGACTWAHAAMMAEDMTMHAFRGMAWVDAAGVAGCCNFVNELCSMSCGCVSGRCVQQITVMLAAAGAVLAAETAACSLCEHQVVTGSQCADGGGDRDEVMHAGEEPQHPHRPLPIP